MAVPREIIDEIRERVKLTELIGEYVRLKRDGSGGRSKGLCPFHSERTPSFSVSDDRGFYYCFGCHASGDCFKFLTEHTGMGFMEAVETLAGRTGVELPRFERQDPADSERKKRGKEAYYRVMSASNAYFRKQLAGEGGASARTYLEERGVDAETAERFQLGFAPDGWTGLVGALCADGVPPAHLVRAGLARAREGQNMRQQDALYDAFRNRVMFPILALNGKPIAFSGRALSQEERAKYINSPETRFYTKGEHLYGIHAARRGMRARNQAVLVEGNFDVVSLHAAGIDEAVAPLGTALTARQAEKLGRFCPRIIIAFDGDRAGRTAAHKAFETLLAAGIDDVRWLMFGDGEDPDSFVRARGGAALRARIADAPTMIRVVLDEALAPARQNPDPTVRREAMRGAADWLRRLPDAYVATTWREEVARKLLVSPQTIRHAESAARKRDRLGAVERPEEALPPEDIVRLTRHEQALVCIIDADPERLARIERQQLYRLMMTPRFAATLQNLARQWVKGADTWKVLIENCSDRAVASAIFGVLAGDAVEVSTSDDAFETLLGEFQTRWIQKRSSDIESRLSEAQRAGDTESVSKLLMELDRLHRYRETRSS